MTTVQYSRKKLECAAYREFETSDSNDKQFSDGGPMALHAAYHVYYGAQSVITGWNEFDEFTIPQGALSLSAVSTVAITFFLLY